jgi:23S rRNA pseudouridine2605 synthase
MKRAIETGVASLCAMFLLSWVRTRHRLLNHIAKGSSLSSPVPLIRYLTLHCAQVPSRRQAARLLKQGLVTVNGAVATAPGLIVRNTAVVTCDGLAIRPHARHLHVLLNKLSGHLTSRGELRFLPSGDRVSDTRPSVYDLLDASTRSRQCVAVGRLDLDTTGVLLFTTDGMLANGLLGPDSQAEKKYYAKLRAPGPLSSDAIARLAHGVTLPNGRSVSGVATNVEEGVNLVIHGGANHQVKHMLNLVSRPLRDLHRSAFAGLTLGGLPAGQSRELTAAEVESIYKIAGM